MTIGPGDEFSVGTSPDGEPGILIEQTAFVETDRWLCFGEGFDDVRRIKTVTIPSLVAGGKLHKGAIDEEALNRIG